jgi:hypothetical protein
MVLEFGVAAGHHINKIAQMTERTVFGFDSFEGLPDAWSLWPKGHYDMGARLPEVLGNVRLIKGWFHESLPPFLEMHKDTVAFVHVDCDLYASTETVLELLHPRFVPGTTIVFDDFMCEPGWEKEEHKAFFDYVKRHQVAFKYIGYVAEIPSCAAAVQFTHFNDR